MVQATVKQTRTEPQRLVSYYRSGEALRSRSVGAPVLAGRVDLPTLPGRLLADWERDIAHTLGLQAGDVEALPLARARMRWPDYQHCVQALTDWTRERGLQDVLAHSEVALMACRGARYHHDGVHYGGMAFCNLFLSEDRGLDLHFASTGQRIALTRGTAVVFDTAQPHGVIARHRSGFDATDFAPERDCNQVFLSWELPIEHAQVAQALQIGFDLAPVNAWPLQEEQVWLNGAPATVCPETGRWRLYSR
jgi:hypothetical protein